MIAKFCNNYTTTLYGSTNILGSLSWSYPIDAYRFTCTEILARDATPHSSGTSSGPPSIQITDTGVEI